MVNAKLQTPLTLPFISLPHMFFLVIGLTRKGTCMLQPKLNFFSIKVPNPSKLCNNQLIKAPCFTISQISTPLQMLKQDFIIPSTTVPVMDLLKSNALPLQNKPLKNQPKLSKSTKILIFLPLLIFGFIYIFLYPKEFYLQSLVKSCTGSTYTSVEKFTDPVTRKPDFRLLIGVLTRADWYERRHLLRMVYSLQMGNLTAHVDVKYVFCRLYKDDQRILVPLEILKHDDIIIMDCEENLNDGKTYSFFSSIAQMYNGTNGEEKPYDYVMKADDDIFIRLQKLIDSLNPMPKEDMYYGFVIPCDSMDPFREYMSGMGYVLSWDLVEWIASSDIARNNTRGAEDKMTGQWFQNGNKAKNRFNTKPAMYDFPIPIPIDSCSHKFIPDTIAVHRLKDNPKWATTLKYFNFTDGLKPSKFYRID